MGEGAESLSPYDTKVLHTSPTVRQGGEAAVENITDQVSSEATDDGLGTPVAIASLAGSIIVNRFADIQSVGCPAEGKGYWDLDEKTNRSKSI